MFLLILLIAVTGFSKCVTVSIFSGYPLPEGYTSLLINSYLQYMYELMSPDRVELRLDGTRVIECMPINDQPAVLRALRRVGLNTFSVQSCISNFYLDQIESNTTLYLIMNKSPCTSQTAAIAALKDRGTTIYPIGFGADVSIETLIEFANGNKTRIDYVHFV